MSSIAFVELLRNLDFRFYTGVPDSVLRGFCQALSLYDDIEHFPAANEGAAVALGIGRHLTTGTMPVVYLQNAGLWNALNPFFSLAHPDVYDIPLLFIVGWRGRPGTIDEPQHLSTGAVTEDVLTLMGIRHMNVDDWNDTTALATKDFLEDAIIRRQSVAIVVSAGVFDEECLVPQTNTLDSKCPKRNEVIKVILDYVASDDLVIGGIGHTSRELYSVRKENSASTNDLMSDFLCVGGMGLAHQIAFGAAFQRTSGRVWCIEGDGSFLMHMGALAIVSTRPDIQLYYVLFDNGTHASVGGQPIACKSIDYCQIARNLGFRFTHKVNEPSDIHKSLQQLVSSSVPGFLWVPIRNEPNKKLLRPAESFIDRKYAAMRRRDD